MVSRYFYSKKIDSLEIEKLDTKHGDLNYIYYIWQAPGKTTWISIFNEEDDLRYCAFIDIIRPSYFENIMKLILNGIGLVLKNTKSIFYKNWKMI